MKMDSAKSGKGKATMARLVRSYCTMCSQKENVIKKIKKKTTVECFKMNNNV